MDFVEFFAGWVDVLVPPEPYCNNPTCELCKPAKFDFDDFLLKNGMLIFIHLPIGLIIFYHYPSIWTIVLFILFPYIFKILKSLAF